MELLPIPHTVRIKSLCSLSPTAGSCHEPLTVVVLVISSLGESPGHPSRPTQCSRTGQHCMARPQLVFLSACSHPPHIFPLLHVGCLRTLCLPEIFGNINSKSDRIYSNHPFQGFISYRSAKLPPLKLLRKQILLFALNSAKFNPITFC